MQTDDISHHPRARSALLLLAALTLALAALAFAGPGSAAADPVCEDTPYGQVCQDLETEDCNPPDCQDPAIHAWPDPLGQTQGCVAGQFDPYTGCDQGVVTVRVPGATSVTTVPTPDQAPLYDKVNSSKESICSKYTYGPNCEMWPPDR